MKKTYDVLVIGPVSLDHNIDYQGNERKEVGGAVVAGPVLTAAARRVKRLACGPPASRRPKAATAPLCSPS